MKFAIAIAIIFSSLTAFAQAPEAAKEPTIEYRFLGVSVDSFFIIQVETGVPTPENPMPQKIETPILFKGKADFEKKIEGTREQVAKARKDAKDLQQRAAKLDKAILDLEAVLTKNESFFDTPKQAKN